MAELKISNFNLALFQKLKKPITDEQFSEIYSTVLKYFPLVDQLSNPILIARRQQGGQISLNPVFLQFLNMETKDFDSDISITKDISSVYFAQYRTEKINQIAIRLVSTIQAQLMNSERQLLINESFKLSSETINKLNPEGKINLGLRLVFQRGGKNYDLRIEPYFTKPDLNYVDLNIVIPDLDRPPDISYDLLYEGVHFLKENISKLIP